MPELSLQNIEQIMRDIRKQEITFSHLLDDLVDHLCCDVENEMNQGLSFDDAYNKVKKKIGKRRLKEIQEDTLYAIDTKYRKMKNTMKISGVAGTVLLGFATLFKIMHWPAAGIMILLGAVILAFIFMPSALGVLWRETRSGKQLFLFFSAFFASMFFICGILFKLMHWPGTGIIITLAAFFSILLFIPSLLINQLRDPEKRSKSAIYILGAVGLIFYILGLLFKMQHWPGVGVFMLCGMLILFFIVFPWYTRVTWKEENFVSASFIFMTIGSLAYIIPSALISINLQRSYDQGFYIHQQQEQALFKYKFNENQSYLKNINDTAVSTVLGKIHLKTLGLLKTINGIEANMIAESEGEPGKPVKIKEQIIPSGYGPEIQFNRLILPFITEPVKDYLLPETTSRKELDAACKEYLSYLSGLTTAGELGKFEKLLDSSVYIKLPGNDGWKISMMNGLHSLALLKISILTVESEVFGTLSKQQ